LKLARVEQFNRKRSRITIARRDLPGFGADNLCGTALARSFIKQATVVCGDISVM
jgi:hypothetical protein